MKLITAVIKPFKLEDVRQALGDVDAGRVAEGLEYLRLEAPQGDPPVAILTAGRPLPAYILHFAMSKVVYRAAPCQAPLHPSYAAVLRGIRQRSTHESAVRNSVSYAHVDPVLMVVDR